MSWRERHYSRLVAWLKILLPLAALGLLSTLFLLSRDVATTPTIPFSQIELEERMRGQQITSPAFAGATARGDLIALTAASATPVADERGQVKLSDLKATIDLLGGTRIILIAGTGAANEADDLVRLDGGVIIESSIGYRITARTLETGLRSLRAETDQQIDATGPPGRFSAGAMRLIADPDGSNAHLVFTNGVKLVYEPAD